MLENVKATDLAKDGRGIEELRLRFCLRGRCCCGRMVVVHTNAPDEGAIGTENKWKLYTK
jgi:hypothetical protein